MNNPYGPSYVPSGKVPNHLILAILSTLFCCLPLGIASIVYAVKVDGFLAAGNIQAAHEASQKAKKWAIWSAASMAVLCMGTVYLFVVSGAFGY